VIVPTRRLLFLGLLGVAAVALTGTVSLASEVAALWLVALLILALADAWFVPGKAALVWTRHHEPKLSLGAWNQVTLSLANTSGRRLRYQVRDAVPQLLVPDADSASGETTSGTPSSVHYRVYPVHRGDYRFGAITARYLGPLGLVWRQQRTVGPAEVKIYPNLLAVRRYESLLHRGMLHEIGLRRSRRRGSGTEFERLREYTPDDEYRRINWTATARRHAPIATEYTTERAQNILILVDTGRLMAMQVPYAGELEERDDLGPREAVRALTKLDHAVNAALLLAFVSQETGDRVGLLAFSDRVSAFVKAAPGRRQFLTLTEALYDLQPHATESDYGTALGYLRVHSPRRALAVIFTDIAHEAAAASLLTHVASLARRHLPLIVTMRDPAIEAVSNQEPADSASVYERAVARDLLARRDVALSRLRAAGALTLDVPADQLSPSVINRYLEIKAQGRL
jgi:uncharacterized protein (DUF58 family)